VAEDKIIVAIDGPSGVGKSTVARRLASRLRLPYLETGAMYRALGVKVAELGIDPDDRPRVEALASNLDLELREQGENEVLVLLDQRPLDQRARAPRISEVTSRISTYSKVRQEMVRRQRTFARRRGAVIEGRDIGTKVFPGTSFKFFLTAPMELRVERRLEQLAEAGHAALERDEIAAELTQRDYRDSHRTDSPLALDDTYEVVDTGQLDVEGVVEAIADSIDGIREAEKSRS
jgi:cytidylate kinase